MPDPIVMTPDEARDLMEVLGNAYIDPNRSPHLYTLVNRVSTYRRALEVEQSPPSRSPNE